MPARFYTGLVAELYSILRSENPDPTPYRRFIAAFGEPALELGCGDGDPMLALRLDGVDVEGLDSSADILAEAGRLMRCTTVSADRDGEARQQVIVLRYELEQDGRSTSLERPWVLHWHTQEGFRALAEAAGLTVTAVLAATGEPAAPDADQFTFLLTLG